MKAKRIVDKTKPHYRVKLFYPRTHEMVVQSKAQLDNYLQGRKLNGTSPCYAEVWAMRNDQDGEQVMLLDQDNVHLVPTV